MRSPAIVNRNRHSRLPGGVWAVPRVKDLMPARQLPEEDNDAPRAALIKNQQIRYMKKKSQSRSNPGESTPLNLPAADVLSAVPRVSDLQFSEQLAADEALGNVALAAMVRQYVEEIAKNRLAWWQASSFALPCDGDSVLCKALARVRTRLRLGYDVRLYTSVQNAYARAPYRGIRDGKTLHIFLSQAFLNLADPCELSFHLAQGIWEAIDEGAFFVRCLAKCPLNWNNHQLVRSRERYAAYSAAIYGLLACGEVDMATRESWRAYSSIQSPLDVHILRRMSERAIAEGDASYWERQLNDCHNARYPLLLPEVLQAFTRTSRCHALLGPSVGSVATGDAIDWLEFSAQIVAHDEHLHAPSEEWIDALSATCAVIRPLATASILEGYEGFSNAEIRDALERSEMLPSSVDRYLESEEWQLGAEGNTLQLLKGMLSSQNNARRMQFCSADLLRKIAIVVLVEGTQKALQLSEEQAPEVVILIERFVELACHLGIEEGFARSYLSAVSEWLAERQSEEDASTEQEGESTDEKA